MKSGPRITTATKSFLLDTITTADCIQAGVTRSNGGGSGCWLVILRRQGSLDLLLRVPETHALTHRSIRASSKTLLMQDENFPQSSSALPVRLRQPDRG